MRLSLAGADWPNIWPPPSAAELTIDRAGLVLTVPRVEGLPAIAEPPVFSPSTGIDAHAADTDEAQPPVVWRLEHDVLGRETRAVIEHGSAYEGEHDSRVEEVYDGTIGVSTEDPGAGWARARASYRIAWPEAECVTETRLDFRSDAEAYHVAVDLVAEEPGGGLGRVERRWERVIPRRLQ